MEGDTKFEDSQNLPDFPYAEYALSLGLRGIKVDDPERLSGAWQELLNADRPAVLEVVTDPNIPPLPPHITREQALHYTEALLKGDPDRGQMIFQTIKQKIAEYFAG
jgi:pyruvate dehydrogenase (quinone)